MMHSDINRKYKTRNGMDIRIYATDGIGQYNIHGAILKNDGWTQAMWTNDGLFYHDTLDDRDIIK